MALKKRQFRMYLTLENAGMLTGADIAAALRITANCLEPRTMDGLTGCESKVWDVNGNVVGRWVIEEGSK